MTARSLAVPPCRHGPLTQPGGAAVAGTVSAVRPSEPWLTRARRILAKLDALPDRERERRAGERALVASMIEIAEKAEERR